jgi:membrane protease YdiL (CAAX protease family)
LITVSIALATVGLSAYLARSFQWARRLEAEFYKLFSDLTKSDLFLLALFSGIGEEFFFRGAMQPAFGYVITSLLFGSIHFIPKKVFLPWTIFACVMGFTLGWVYIYSGNLLFPVIAHFMINYLNLSGICRRKTQEQGSSITESEILSN